MAGIDSKAVFAARAAEVGVTQATIDAMVGRTWDTLASFAYSCSYVPGQTDDRDFVEKVMTPVLGPNPNDHADAPRIRRLFFEAHTLAVADLRRRVSGGKDEDEPSRMPIEEHHVRLVALKRKLTGLVLAGPNEPSHRFVDSLVQQLETGQLKYLPWSSCMTREDEVQGKKVSTGGWHGTELELMQLLTRRSIGYELAGLCPFDTLQVVTTRYINELSRSPLSGYAVSPSSRWNEPTVLSSGLRPRRRREVCRVFQT